MQPLRQYLELLADLLFPPCCPICGDIGDALCRSCRKKISEAITVERTVLETGITVLSLLTYADPVKQLIWSCKFRNRRTLIPVIASLVSDHFPQEFRNAQIIIPVPIHPHRYTERGFNQAEEFVRTCAEKLDIPLLTDVLARTTETHALYALGRSEREQMMSHTMTCGRPEAVTAKDILLFDDIITTGTTLRECGSVLLKCGARSVRALTLCRA